jgi:hypothetical protein
MRPTPLFVLALALTVGCGDKPDDTADANDADGDGFNADIDCDDDDPAVNPSATEVPYDGVDNDCNSATYDDDLDGDAYASESDCDDDDPDIHPGADEYCDGIDNDCDDEIDEDDAVDATAWLPDDDGDGYGDLNTHLARASCSEISGHVANASDCDDSDAAVHPDADEYCNQADDDCDGDVDEDPVDASTWFLDYDGDGYAGDAYTEAACEQPSGFLATAEDCDDLDAAVHPDADEDYCNEVDDDCDGEVDEWDDAEAPATWYEDLDGDGYGNSAVAASLHPSCDGPDGYTAEGGDCDETDPETHPGADEWCDGFDNDCDGVTDEDDALDALPWFEDADTDGYGWFYDEASMACTQPTGFVADNTDCDDTDAAIFPGAGSCTWATVAEIQTGVYVAGDIVTVVGWVMHDTLSTGFHLADASGAWNGVWVYTNSSTMLEGDEVVLFGEVAEYNDLTELMVTAPSTDIVLLDSGATLPVATVVPTVDLADPTIAESYEGVLVTVENVEIEDSDLGYAEWSVDDGVIIDDLLYETEVDLAEGGSFTSITGLLYHSFGDFKIEPRYAADLVGYTEPTCTADTCVDDLVVGDLVVSEFMFNPDFCGDSSCEWIELYNASGGSVDINGLIIVDDGGNTATVTGSPVMASGSYIVLAIGDSSTWGYTGFTPDGYYGSTVALGNTGDQITIANSLGDLDTAAAYTGGNAGFSQNLDPTGLDVTSNDATGYWCEPTSAIGTTGDFGTPGAANDSCS